MIKRYFYNLKNKNIILKEIEKLNDFNVAISKDVINIINDIKQNGDRAIIKYEKLYDGVDLKEIKVNKKEIKNAYKKVDKNVLKAINLAIKNIRDFHKLQLKNLKGFIYKNNSYKIIQKYVPVDSAGIYIPGGQAPLFSTVIMAVIPAKVAGVKRIIITSPPKSNGSINPYILVAADMLGVSEIYKIGGPMAIAAMTFGTKTVPRVDKIAGPGNIYSTMAKKYVYGMVGIDALNGPSEITVFADESANPLFIAYDLLAQAEHINGHSLLITTSKKLSDEIFRLLIDKNIKSDIMLVIVKNVNQAIEIINKKGPEHLEIISKNIDKILKNIKNAPAIFTGNFSPVAFGDYMAGANHILPTNGTSRFSSALSVFDFLKHTHIVNCSKETLKKFGGFVEKMAETEGLTAHAKSIEIRRK
jgi:histidinol dehydrogenase